MTIYNTITNSEVDTLKTKTDVIIHHDRTVAVSRIIKRRIYQYLIVNDEEKGPVTMKQVHPFTTMDDELFKLVVDSTQDPQ